MALEWKRDTLSVILTALIVPITSRNIVEYGIDGKSPGSGRYKEMEALGRYKEMKMPGYAIMTQSERKDDKYTAISYGYILQAKMASLVLIWHEFCRRRVEVRFPPIGAFNAEALKAVRMMKGPQNPASAGRWDFLGKSQCVDEFGQKFGLIRKWSFGIIQLGPSPARGARDPFFGGPPRFVERVQAILLSRWV